MAEVKAGITSSLDGFTTGPNDGPGCGLGDGGERLHYWVFGGPWTYDDERPDGGPIGVDKEVLDETMASLGAVVGGRGTYEAAEAWGGSNPWDVPFFVVTHRTEDEPKGAGFTFVDGLATAIEDAREAAGSKDVLVMGGADVIRQALQPATSVRSRSQWRPWCSALASRCSAAPRASRVSSLFALASRPSRPTSRTAS